MGWKPKGNPCKIKGIPLGWELRQKLGIIPEEEEDLPIRSLLPSYEMHHNHWGFSPISSPLGYLSLAHKPQYTSGGPHNDFWTKKYISGAHKQKAWRKYEYGLSPTRRAESEKCAKTKLKLSLPRTHHLFAMVEGTPNTTCSKEGRSLPMVGKMRSLISGSPMTAPNSSIVGHSSTPLKPRTRRVGTQ